MTEFLFQLSDYLPLSSLATHIGVTCLFFQLALALLFNKRTGILPDGPWSHLPGFTAHQIVTLPLMVILTYVGMKDWFFNPYKDVEGATATDRIFGYSNSNDIPLAIGSGAILLWDIPAGFSTPQLRDPLMWAHHIGMFLVASTMSGLFCKWGNQLGYYYASFFFGVIEISSFFLTYVDLFHPKYKHYHVWLNKQDSGLKKILNDLNELARVLFAVSFLAIRGIYFPYVVFRSAIPDLLEAYQNPPDGVPQWTCYFLIGSMSAFALLQAYWGVFIGKQIKKAFAGSEGGEKKKD